MNRQHGKLVLIPVLALFVAVTGFGGAAFAQPTSEQLLLWNRLESEQNVENSDYGPGFYLTTYIYDFWEEAQIEPAMFGNGLYVNHDTGEGWIGDGANFFALDLWDVGLTPERGTIEFWFKFKYECRFHNHAYFFITINELAGHVPGPPSTANTGMAGAWSGWNLPDRKYYYFSIANWDWSPTGRIANTPVGSAGPGGHLEFQVDSLHHFGFVWDVDGIDGSADTMQLYVNGNLEASTTEAWDTIDPVQRYLYLGSRPSYGYWDTFYNAVKGVTDNLKIWDYAKTDFSDRFSESPCSLFEDHFDDGMSAEWTLLSGSAWVEDGWLHLQDQVPAFPRHGHIMTHDGDSSWTDYRMTVRVDGLPTQDPYTGAWYQRGTVCFRTRDTILANWPLTRGYWLTVVGPGDDMSPPGLYLSHVDNYSTTGYQLAAIPCNVPDEPVEVTIDVLGPRIRVWLYGDQIIDVVDPDPFLYGGIGFDTIWESHARFDDVVVSVCNEAPVCCADGPYMAECEGATTSSALDGSGSYDPDPNDTISYAWTSDCPGASFDNANIAEPNLTLDSGGSCTTNCTVTLTVTDSYGASASCSAAVTVEDTTPPAVSGPGNLTVECDGAGNAGELSAWESSFTATDVCNEVTIQKSVCELPVCCSAYRYGVNMIVHDECDHPAACGGTFTVEDSTPPTIDPQASDETVECDGSGNTAELNAWLSSHGGAEAWDICCHDEITWSHDFAGLSDECGATGSATVTFTATDGCGLAASTTATFTIVDTTEPAITCPADVTVTCPEPTDPNATGWATATDVCDDDPAVFVYREFWSIPPCPADPVMYEIARFWRATDECGNSSECVQTITVMNVVLDLDIKAGSCPNSFNRNSHGVLPVGLLGTGEFDVTTVDLGSILLSRADCVGGEVAPHEGPPGPHSVYEDVGTPFDGELCGCHELGGDGLVDLSMKFRVDELVPALELDGLSPGALVELVVSGALVDGCAFTAADCVRLVPPGSSPGVLSVASNAAGAWVDVDPLDETLDGGGFADFVRTYPSGSVVTLTASQAHEGLAFYGWELNGQLQRPRSVTIEVVVPAEILSLEAVYGEHAGVVVPKKMEIQRRQ